MYKPAPPRPKKTNITRTRTGCLECRARRVRIVAPLRGHHGGSIREPSQPNITATKAADGSRHARTEFQT
ncbi:hypothetical protein MY8738_003606 [Beauveria namnaoensis]